ncbi:hypothetical protein DEU56DRAFT_897328 [Suillus clintonianus]|uniref:uncharacterized protein n=1 Tax=Suillus clintonianus TaxID=1904413 RepID=UPI001B861966|nr:uncharacterized protein DEU56DRAFT_897328 [Suillus clintonianus]KAG2156333.1 hypothetical protein DEU56DRAFT_897328 [Suillus clintonianus]
MRPQIVGVRTAQCFGSGLYLDKLRYKALRESNQMVLRLPFTKVVNSGVYHRDSKSNSPSKQLEACWGLKWCPKFYARGPSDYDIGVLTPDGKYGSLKIGGPPPMEHGVRVGIEIVNPSTSLFSTIHEADGQLGFRRRELPSSPSSHFSVTTPPVSIAHERTQDRPDLMCFDVTPAHSSLSLIAPGRMEGALPIHSEPYTSELSYALLPGPSPHSSQSCGAPTVGTPQHLHYLSPQIPPAVSQDPDGLLYSVAPEDGASLERLASATADAQAYLPPNTINIHSTPQVYVMTTMQTPQAALLDSWNNLDFSPGSATPMTCSTSFSTDSSLIGEFEQYHGPGVATPMTCSTSFSADSSLIGEFEQHHGPGVATPMTELMGMDMENSPQSNRQAEAAMTDEYWRLSRTLSRSSPMHYSRGLSPIDMMLFMAPSLAEATRQLLMLLFNAFDASISAISNYLAHTTYPQGAAPRCVLTHLFNGHGWPCTSVSPWTQSKQNDP